MYELAKLTAFVVGLSWGILTGGSLVAWFMDWMYSNNYTPEDNLEWRRVTKSFALWPIMLPIWAVTQSRFWRRRTRSWIAPVGWLLLFAATASAEVCNLDPALRQHNWGQPGSCGHASTVSALRWVQLYDAADWWKRHYSNGENWGRHLNRLSHAGITVAETHDGDEKIFELADRERRMAVVYWPSNHITDFVGLTNENGRKSAWILDNNHTQHFDRHDYDSWIQAWRRCSGCAFVIEDGQPTPERN